MKLFSKSIEYYIDATFTKSPRDYYQILNILCYDENSKSNIPVFLIPMNSKSVELYNTVFNEILNIFYINNIKIEFKNKTIMCNFEKFLRISLKNLFKGINIKGYFSTILNVYEVKQKK